MDLDLDLDGHLDFTLSIQSIYVACGQPWFLKRSFLVLLSAISALIASAFASPEGFYNNLRSARSSEVKDIQEHREEALKIHNELRALHGVPEMTLDDELTESAQKWCDHLTEIRKFEHSTSEFRETDAGEYVGENIASMGGGFDDYSTSVGTQNWYNEINAPGYDFNNPGYQDGTGHFTQVVWKDSVRLGVGVAIVGESGNKYAVYVAHYAKGGNINSDEGEYFQINVLRPIAETK